MTPKQIHAMIDALAENGMVICTQKGIVDINGWVSEHLQVMDRNRILKTLYHEEPVKKELEWTVQSKPEDHIQWKTAPIPEKTKELVARALEKGKAATNTTSSVLIEKEIISRIPAKYYENVPPNSFILVHCLHEDYFRILGWAKVGHEAKLVETLKDTNSLNEYVLIFKK